MISARVCGIFNAGHEEALASGLDNFTPSKAAMAIGRDLALLPYWGMGCDAVVVPDVEECARFLSSLPLSGRGKTLVASLGEARGAAVEPWGWDRAVACTARKAGLAVGVEFDGIDMLSRLQNRRFSSAFLSRLLPHLRSCEKLAGLRFAGESHFAKDEREAEEIIRKLGKCVLKRPVSGSGRGILIAENGMGKRERDWCRASCNRGGGVEIQRHCEKIADFAMEFRKEKGKPYEFLGYSEFSTDAGGGYGGNFLSQGSLRGGDIWRIAGASAEQVRSLELCIMETLNSSVPEYAGFLGIDMMLCKTGQGTAVFPCVEMNFRHTMGMVANSLGIVPAGGCAAWFRILSKSRRGELLAETRKLAGSMPLEKAASNGGRECFAAGYLPLTPVKADTQFHACMFFECGGRFAALL